MSKQNINVPGTILNLGDQGFDMISSFKEITDNSFGAGATRIRFFIDMKTLTLYVIDDGKGMNKQELIKLATLNDRKEISRAKQGKYGQGVKLAFVYLTQNKHPITIISKTNNHGLEEDPINQIVIDFAGSIETGNYNPNAERSSSLNEALFQKFTQLFGGLATGTLIKIKMDKRIFKELYRKIISPELSRNMLYEMAIINKANLTIPNNEITFHMQHNHARDNEPIIQVCEPLEHEDCEDDKSICSSDDDNGSEVACVSSVKVFDNNSWDVECSDEYTELLRVPVICLMEKATQVRTFNCVVLQNPNQDISYLLENGVNRYEQIEPENLHSFRKLPLVRSGEISAIAKAMNCKILGNFAVNLGQNDDWVQALHDKLFQICGALPTNKKDPRYSKLLSCIKGHYYYRSGVCALNARLEAKHTAGGTMATRKFEENIIVCVDYEPLLDKQFGVTVKKYSTIEKIVDAGILTIIYYLKKTWGKDYEKACKAKKDADDRALLEAHRLKKQQEEDAWKKIVEASRLKKQQEAEKAKALKDAEDAAKAQAKALEDAAKAQEETEETEDSNDELEEDQSETSSISSQGSRSGSEIEEPKLIQRASSSSILVKKGELMHYLDDWLDENIHMQELEAIISFMCKEYQLYKPSVADMVLAILTLPQKIQQLVAEINARYMSDRDAVLCGSDFYNSYKKYFKK